MKLTENQQKMLRMLPGVDQLLESFKNDPDFEGIPKAVVVNSIRRTLKSQRDGILSADRGITEQSLSLSRIVATIKEVAAKAMTPNLKSLINATGIVVHTNLGRSLLPPEAGRELRTRDHSWSRPGTRVSRHRFRAVRFASC